MIIITLQLVLAVTTAHAADRLDLPSSSTVMDCGKPDPRETKQDGTFTCTNDYKKEVPNAKFTLRKGKLEGKALGYREDGTPEFEGTYKNGLKEGEIKTSWSDKEKRFNKTTHYRDGKREGVETERNNSGDDMNVRFYKNDELYGYSYFIRANKIEFISDCRIGDDQRAPKEKCDGFVIPGFEKQWTEFQAKEKAKADQKVADANREVIRKNRNGVIVERYQLKNSQTWGKHERFFDNGKPYLVSEEEASRRLSEIEYFDDGNLKRKSKYDSKSHGEISREEFYQNGKPKLSWTKTVNDDRTTTQKFKEYFDNGQLQIEGVRRGTVFSDWDGDYDGDIKFYAETGELIATEHYKDKKKDGVQRSNANDENKKPIIIEELYANGVLQKVTTIDGETKKPRRIQEFMPDGSTKSDKKF